MLHSPIAPFSRSFIEFPFHCFAGLPVALVCVWPRARVTYARAGRRIEVSSNWGRAVEVDSSRGRQSARSHLRAGRSVCARVGPLLGYSATRASAPPRRRKYPSQPSSHLLLGVALRCVVATRRLGLGCFRRSARRVNCCRARRGRRWPRSTAARRQMWPPPTGGRVWAPTEGRASIGANLVASHREERKCAQLVSCRGRESELICCAFPPQSATIHGADDD